MKIVFFDYWTKGFNNFVRYDKALKSLGHETLLLHVGSLRDKHCPKEEYVHDLKCRDISYYNTNLLHRVLEQERPDVVLTLNAKSLMDRALVLSCRRLGIKSIFIPHGINPFADEPDMGVSIMERSFNGFFTKLSRAKKYISSMIPNYYYSLIKSHPSIGHILRSPFVVYSYFHNPGKAVIVPSFVDELSADRLLAFSQRAREHFVKVGYPESSVRVVGNPGYDNLLKRVEQNGFSADNLPNDVAEIVTSKRPYALILDDAFPELMNLGGWTHEYRNEHYSQISERLAREGYLTVIKMHPGAKMEFLNVDSKTAHIHQTADLDALIYFSDFCICHTSTTIENCVLLNKVVLQPHWNLSKNVPDYFGRRAVTNYWENLNDPLNLYLNEVARKKHKEECITVLKPIAIQNVISELTQTNQPHHEPLHQGAL